MKPPLIEGFTLGEDLQDFLSITGQVIMSWPEKLALGAVLSSVFAFLGADVVLYYIFLAMTISDFALGVTIGFKSERGLDLSRLRQGVKKLVAFNIYIFLAGVMGVTASHVGFAQVADVFVNLFIGYLVFYETISVIRTMEILGFTPPPLLKKFVHRMTRKSETTVIEDYKGERDCDEELRVDKASVREDHYYHADFDLSEESKARPSRNKSGGDVRQDVR